MLIFALTVPCVFYTGSNNLIQTVTGANGCTTTYSYANGASTMLGLPTGVTNPNNVTTGTSYEDDGRITSSWIASLISVEREYNSEERLTGLDRGGYNGNDPTKYHQYYHFTYDEFGNTVSISVGDTNLYNLGAYTYAPYDGLLTGMSYGNGNTVSYTYDNLGRKTQTATSSGDSYTYAYTGDGQLYEMRDVAGGLVYRYNYDSIGRLIGSTLLSGSAAALQTWHRYDENGRLSGQTWSFPGLSYTEGYVYDEHGRLSEKTLTLPGDSAAVITPTYDDLSRVSQTATPAATTAFTYAGALSGGGTTGLVSDMTVTSTQTGTGVFAPLHWRYTYDALGNITLLQGLNSSDVVTGSTAYTYDDQSQLTRAVNADGSLDWTYTYDAYGNLRSRKFRYAFATKDQIAYTYGDADWLDLLTAVSGKKNGVNFSGSYVYDGAGNPTSYYNVGDLSSWTMTWKNGRQLATASNGTHTVSYDYDLDGLRTCKIVDGVRHDYFYAGGQLLRETYTQSGTDYVLDFLYDQNGRPFLLYLTQTTGGITTSALYYYILNLQGDVIHLVDASGVPAASYSYDPYGNALTATGSLASVNPLRYRGYYFDPESGLYYLQSRYYDPMLGRFINADETGELASNKSFISFHLFSYCGNNPVINTDPKGTSWFSSIFESILDTAEKAIDSIQDFTSQYNLCISEGITLNASPGLFDLTKSVSVCVDSSGNIALLSQPNATGLTSSRNASASAVVTTSVMFAPTYKAMTGQGVAIGASVFTNYYGLGGGLDYIIGLESNDQHYHGFSLSAGIGVPSKEVHFVRGTTECVCKINIYNALRKDIKKVRSLISSW